MQTFLPGYVILCGCTGNTICGYDCEAYDIYCASYNCDEQGDWSHHVRAQYFIYYLQMKSCMLSGFFNIYTVYIYYTETKINANQLFENSTFHIEFQNSDTCCLI